MLLNLDPDFLSFPTLLRYSCYSWLITMCKLSVYNMLIDRYRKMITTSALANTSIMSHNYYFFVVRTLKKSFNNFQVYNTLFLNIITVLYIRALELTRLLTGNLYPLTNVFPISPTQHFLLTTVLLSVFRSSVSTYKW